MSRLNPRLLEWQVLPGGNVSHELFLSFSRSRPLEDPCSALCSHGAARAFQGCSGECAAPGAVSCSDGSLPAQPAPSRGHCQGHTVWEGTCSRDLSQCGFQRQLDGEMHLWGHQEEFILPFWVHLQGRSEDFLLDAVDFRGREALVHEMRADEHLRHFLALLCFILTEVKESFQLVQTEVVHCHDGDPNHKTEQAWKQTCSLSLQQCPHPTALLGLSPARGQYLCLWEVAFYCMSYSKHPQNPGTGLKTQASDANVFAPQEL